jgi:hypothetical protein
VVCDPEDVGYGLHRTMPRELCGDFQDRALMTWSTFAIERLDGALEARPEFALHIDTGDVSVADVAEQVAKHACAPGDGR